MARLYRADGKVEVVKAKGRRWTALEVETLVGGPFEEMPGIKPMRMFLNEEATLRDQPENRNATNIVLTALQGKTLRYTPVIRGDVLILEPGERA